MDKLNETSIKMDISGFETDNVDDAKSIIDTIQQSDAGEGVDLEQLEELDFNTDLVGDNFDFDADETIGVEDDVIPEMDEDDKLLLEDDPVEDSETIIADLINDGATNSDDIDGAIRECCDLIGESVDNIDFGKIHKLIEGKDASERIVPNDYSPEAYYRLLVRMVQDCKYYLGNGYGFEKHLWAGSVERQIQAMREIYDILPEEPEWLSREDIDEYERKMLAVKAEKEAKREPLDEDTVRQGTSWVNKGKEGTHGKFKTKKEADAQRKAMFASGYKAESANDIPDFDALCEAAMNGEVVGKFYDGDNEADYKIIQRDGTFYIDSDAVLNRDGELGPFASYAEAVHELLSTHPNLTEMPIEDADLDVHFADAKETDFDEDEDFENLFSQLVNGNLDIYRQKLQALGRDGVNAYVSWANENGIPVEELKLHMGLNETSNPDCNYGTKPNPYLKGYKKTPCEMKRVKGFAARDKEQEGFPLRKDDGLSPKVVAIKESAENMLACARSDRHKEAIIRRMADKLLAEGISYSDAIKLLSDK